MTHKDKKRDGRTEPDGVVLQLGAENVLGSFASGAARRRTSASAAHFVIVVPFVVLLLVLWPSQN